MFEAVVEGGVDDMKYLQHLSLFLIRVKLVGLDIHRVNEKIFTENFWCAFSGKFKTIRSCSKRWSLSWICNSKFLAKLRFADRHMEAKSFGNRKTIDCWICWRIMHLPENTWKENWLIMQISRVEQSKRHRTFYSTMNLSDNSTALNAHEV